jgi:Nif-specific regulatory protein
VALAEPGETVAPARLSARLLGILEPVRAVGERTETLRTTMDRIEAWLVRRALDEHGGRRTQTARTLGLTREGLYKKMKRLGVE